MPSKLFIKDAEKSDPTCQDHRNTRIPTQGLPSRRPRGPYLFVYCLLSRWLKVPNRSLIYPRESQTQPLTQLLRYLNWSTSPIRPVSNSIIFRVLSRNISWNQ